MAAIPKLANEIAAQNDASFRIARLEHFAQEWEPAFALAPRLIVCPEKRHMSLGRSRFLFRAHRYAHRPIGFVLPKVRLTLGSSLRKRGPRAKAHGHLKGLGLFSLAE